MKITENGKIWLFLTEETKRIYLSPPEDITMRCTQVTIEQFEQIVEDGFFITSENEGISWVKSPPVKYEMNPLQIKLQKKLLKQYRSQK